MLLHVFVLFGRWTAVRSSRPRSRNPVRRGWAWRHYRAVRNERHVRGELRMSGDLDAGQGERIASWLILSVRVVLSRSPFVITIDGCAYSGQGIMSEPKTVGDVPAARRVGEADDRLDLVRYATMAASSHNTQPWKFRLEPDRIVILPDFGRRCAAVDPDDHHLYASLGCAAENLLQAARAVGFEGRCSFDAVSSGVRIDLSKALPLRSPLFEAIPQRQCSRSEYDGSHLSADELHRLEEAGTANGVSVMLIVDERKREQIAEFVAQGNTAQFADAAWVDELGSWIRFNAGDAMRSGDGLYGPAMGSPAVPRWLGMLFMRFGFSAKQQNRKDIRCIRSSSAIAVFHSDADDIAHWIEAGRCYQRLALQATALGLCTAFINQPVEVARLRPAFARFLGIGDRRPDLVIRIGRGPRMPRSPRRPVADVVV
ncbi:MAG: Tat pathway signal protein [Burkholderiaceae bacterium]